MTDASYSSWHMPKWRIGARIKNRIAAAAEGLVEVRAQQHVAGLDDHLRKDIGLAPKSRQPKPLIAAGYW